ncbi:aminotransferase class IV [Alkaliphilus hydrothermalis]|uniref:4-amino-4-deoxychorismate lyase n=1 Tax=Alkaliphilus hydrothermalis TaxID=1482730 RepID=A0ABS2NQ40_9FIRM|nr:aminotransferase class IV [Alkaliphilus hydrothermalis]MBM7614942.1 4-amino-4-deoxychorismate lyase [Alkaliphilus hydrothermalis]
MLISINGRIVEEGDGGIAPTSEAFLYGYGAFETVKFKGGEIHYLQEHFVRLKGACQVLQIPLEYDYMQIEKFSNELIKASGIKEGGLKILQGKNSRSIGNNGNSNNHQKGYLLLSVSENKYKEESYRKGFKLTFTDIKRNPSSPLTYIKSNNYLDNLLARKEAVGRGYDEVVFENHHGHLCEGAISNLFFVKDGIIHTPHEDCGLLMGIMRTQVMELAKELEIPLEMGKYTRKELLVADEIFMTNSLMEVMPVVRLEVRSLDISNSEITRKVMEAIKKKSKV